jgi:hypothetical protein
MKNILNFIIQNFNNDCSNDENYREKATKKVMAVRENTKYIHHREGVIFSQCKKSRADFEGDSYEITISSEHYHCSCMAYQTSKRDEYQMKKACKHIVFVASSVAIHMAKNGGKIAC